MEGKVNFSKALEAVKGGAKITRQGWNGKGLWVEIQRPDEHSKMTRPYLFLVSPAGSTNQFGLIVRPFERVPWLASQTDLLAEDWEIMAEQVQKTTGKKLYAFRSTRRTREIIYRDSPHGENGFYRREPNEDKVVQ
jgi:hypothetical protein